MDVIEYIHKKIKIKYRYHWAIQNASNDNDKKHLKEEMNKRLLILKTQRSVR